MAALISYFGRDGRQCQKVEWLRLRADPEYGAVRNFDNGVVHVALEWTGEQRDAASTFKDCHTLFKLHVGNYNELGELVRDPIEDGRTFPNEEVALAAYEGFLTRWTLSHCNQDGKYVEVGNIHTPPPPPNPDAPSSEVTNIKLGIEDDGVGAW